MQSKTQKLKDMLEVAAEQGILIYQGKKLATPDDIVRTQQIFEETTYFPDFIVKNSSGEIKEIWYS